MSLKAFLLAAATFTGVSSASGAEPEEVKVWTCDTSDLLIKNVTIWRETGPVQDQSILIQNGDIVEVFDSGDETSVAAGTRIIDGTGKVALPGLIDSHTHFDTLPSPSQIEIELDTVSDVFPITMRQTLSSGVTLTRTHLAALEHMPLMQRMSSDNCFPAPRFSLSGPGLLASAPDVDRSLMRGFTDLEDAEYKITEQAALGAEWLALHGAQNFTEEEKQAIVSTANKAGLKLFADTDSFAALEAALNFNIISGEYVNRSDAPDYPRNLKDSLRAQAGTYFNVPPIGYYYRANQHASKATTKPEAINLEFYETSIARNMAEAFKAGFPNNRYVGRIVHAFDTLQTKFHSLRETGVTLVIGSDSGSPGQFHRDAVWQEMKIWRKWEVPVADIINAATVLPSKMLEKYQAGKISPGSYGDIVLYDGNPQEVGFDRAHVHSVIKGGVIYVSDYKWIGPTTEQFREHTKKLTVP